MECKECKIVCEGKEVAVITCEKDGFTVKCTEECKKLCKGMAGALSPGCCR